MIRSNRQFATALSLAIACTASPVQAGIAELLLKKGVITQEEYQQLKAETAAASAPALSSTPVPAAAPPTPAVSFSKGFVVTGIDGSFQAQVAWALTGEIRPYDVDRGIFKGLTPLRPVGTGGASSAGLSNLGIGGWELALRYSELDLNDQTISGGRECWR